MGQTKPHTFIGSSREAIPLANAVHAQLSYLTQVTPWYAGTFAANDYTMESLERQLDDNDFGVFIFAPDDVALYRGSPVFVTRDNTLFEMGLFWGRLGRRRVFALIPADVRSVTISGTTVEEYHLLSDFHGLNLLRYELRDDDNNAGAVAVACQEILRIMAKEGPFGDPYELLKQKEDDLQRSRKLLHFFWQYNRFIHAHPIEDKHLALYEAARNAIMPPQNFHVTGAAIWQRQGNDGMRQVAGNVGRNRFFPFDTQETDQEKIYVLDVYFSQEWTFYNIRELEEVYVLCYPLSEDYVLSVHFSGPYKLSDDQLKVIVAENSELFNIIDNLIGGNSR